MLRIPSDSAVAVAARLFRGFGDPTRLAILLALSGGEMRVSNLVAAVGSSQPKVSGHLGCLRECGLVVDRPGERRQAYYRIARPEIFELLGATERLLADGGSATALCPNPYIGSAEA